MIILTLNMNSHARAYRREALEKNIHSLARYIQDYQVDVVALQECGQTSGAKQWEGALPGVHHSSGSGIAIKEDNAAALLAGVLDAAGQRYDWTWGGVKQGYGKYDEGLAIFCRHSIRETDFFTISRQDAFDNWKTRKVLGASVRIQERLFWFYDVHMGWWQDEEEPFREQMHKLQKHIFPAPKEKQPPTPIPCSCKFDYRISQCDDALTEEEPGVILLGDFNSPADVPGEGYAMVRELGWNDTWEMAKQKDDGLTVPGAIDGWEDEKTKGMRIDYIWAGEPLQVRSSRVVFSGKKEPVISDHFGVMTEIDLEIG